MKKFLKWFLLFIGFLIVIVPISVFSPLLILISVGAFWYFTKKKPNERFRRIAKNGIIVSSIGLVFMVYALGTADEPEVASVADSEIVGDVEAEADEELLAEEQAEIEAERIKKEELKAKELEESERRAKENLEKGKTNTERRRKQREKEIAEANPNKTGETEAPTKPVEVPEGKEDINVNDNIPRFSNEDITSTEVYHKNGPLDSLGRVTVANAVVGVEIMPAKERGSIGHHEPTGWTQARYANINSGGWLYNRSHLIGHQLTGNDDYANLMTGTRWFNIRMLEYENFVANYVETTENHVRYRITPVFEGSNLVASGAYMEGFSIEDNGEGLMFNIYIPNVQPGVEINYADGSSIGPEGPAQDGEIKKYTPPKAESKPTTTAPKPKPEPKPTPAPAPKPAPEPSNPYVDANGNGLIKGSNNGIYHVPGSQYYNRTTNPAQMFKSIEEAVAAGYRAPK